MISQSKTSLPSLQNCLSAVLSPAVLWAIVGLAAALALSSHGAHALDIKQSEDAPNNTMTLELTGHFEPGDGLKIRAEIAKLPPEQTIVVHFNAGGGTFDEGMSIGRLIHQLGIRTVVPPKARCFSPCPLAFFAGVDPKGGPPLIKHTSANFGFTAFLAGAKERDYSVKDLDNEVAKTQQYILKVFDYLSEIGADADILRRIYEDIPDGQVKYVSDEDLLSLGVSIFDDRLNQLIDARAIRRRVQR